MTKSSLQRQPFLPPVFRILILAGSLVTLLVFAFIAGLAYSRGDFAKGALASGLAIVGLLGIVAPWSLGRRGYPRR